MEFSNFRTQHYVFVERYTIWLKKAINQSHVLDTLHAELNFQETICMKCQILFSKKNITNLSSAESTHSVVSDNMNNISESSKSTQKIMLDCYCMENLKF